MTPAKYVLGVTPYSMPAYGAALDQTLTAGFRHIDCYFCMLVSHLHELGMHGDL